MGATRDPLNNDGSERILPPSWRLETGKVWLETLPREWDVEKFLCAVQVAESGKVETEDGGWRQAMIRLKPDSHDPSFEAIVLQGLEEGELAIIAELVEVLGQWRVTVPSQGSSHTPWNTTEGPWSGR